jgi:hypothetical protein
MCDYSLHHVASRPAKVGDKVVMTEFSKAGTRGFAAVGELGPKLVIHDDAPKVAVCVLPGTELAFDENVRHDRAFSFLGKGRVNHKVARFRQIDMDDPQVQHDALEFPDGQVLKVTQLVAGQTATVLQLPVAPQHHDHVETRSARAADSRIALNRLPSRQGAASLLVPNQSAVLLCQALRSAAIELSAVLTQSFRRLKAQPQHSMLPDALPAGVDTSFNGMLPVTLPQQPAAQRSDKKIDVKAAA